MRGPGPAVRGAPLDEASSGGRWQIAVRTLDVIAVVTLACAVTAGAIGRGRPEHFVVATALVVGARAWLRPLNPGFAARSPVRSVLVGVLVYVAGMGFIVLTRHHALRTHALDLGQYAQTIWSIAHGDGPASTIIPGYVTTVRMNAFGDHFSPIFYAMAPFVRLFPHVSVPLLIQTLALALGAVAVFAHARRRLPEPAAAGLATIYLLNPSVHGINIRDIHPAAFVIPAILAAAAAHDARRFGWCALFVVAAAACREDAAIAVVGFAIWLAFARRRVLVGALVAIAGVLLLALDLTVLMPYFRSGAPYHHLYRYTHLGTDLGEIMLTIAFRPWRWLAVPFTVPKLVYALAMLAPLGFLPLLAPRTLLAAAPALAMNLMSVDPVLLNYRAQYQSFVLPFLVLAAIDGAAALRARAAGRRRPAVAHPGRGPAFALGAAACFAVILTARTFNDFSVRHWRLAESQRAAHALMGRVPRDAAVSANERLVPQLCMRRDVFVYPRGLGISAYVVELADVIARQPASGYRETARGGGWVLLERAGG
jgi:uncharacterized membrane protein